MWGGGGEGGWYSVMGNSAPGRGASEAVMIAPEDTGPHTNQCNVSCARDRG